MRGIWRRFCESYFLFLESGMKSGRDVAIEKVRISVVLRLKESGDLAAPQ
jgi:hypothetical protein